MSAPASAARPGIVAVAVLYLALQMLRTANPRVLAKAVRGQLQASRGAPDAPISGAFNPSTTRLLQRYLAAAAERKLSTRYGFVIRR